MNSLQELNNYNNSLTYSYTDNRIATLTFDRTTPTNQSLVVNEGASFSHPIGIEVTEVINHTTSLPTLTINLTAVAGLTINWASLPAGVTATEISAGIWRVSGWTNVAHWDQIKSPTITCPQSIPNAYFGTFTYTATVGYVDGALGAQTKSYTVSVSVLDVTFMTNPTVLSYNPSSTIAITGSPQIVDVDATYPGAIFTVVGTPSPNTSVSSFTSSGGGGTFSYNAGTKAFTITGTRAQVNARLNSLSLVSNAVETDFVLNYLLTNNQDATNDSKNQQVRNTSTQYLSNANTVSATYIEDNASYATVIGSPNITDLDSDGSGTYTMEVFPASTTYITDMFSSGVGGSQSFNAATKKLTITGTRTQVNSHLNAISFRPGEDIQILFIMNYKLSLPSPSTTTVTKTQNFVCSLSHDEVSNISIARSYTANNSNLIFASNTPQIVDQDTLDPNVYTITLNCSFGQWLSPNNISPLVYGSLANPLSISGTKTELNAKISLIKFYPNSGVSSNGVFTYTQSKNGTLQVSTTVALNGNAGSYTNNLSYTFYATRTWTPSIEDVLYGQVTELHVVGGGGGGGADRGGGGGGGYVAYVPGPFYLSPNTTYTFTIGTGGAGASDTALTSAQYGNTSSAFGYSANGGGPGGTTILNGHSNGGISGLITNYSPLVYVGYEGGTGQSGAGGGGAGGAQGGSVIGAANVNGGTGAVGQTTAIYSVFGSGGGGGGQTGGAAGNIYAGRGGSSLQPATTRDPNWNGVVPSNPEISSQQSPAPTVNAYGGGGGGGGGAQNQVGAQGNNGLVRFRIIPR